MLKYGRFALPLTPIVPKKHLNVSEGTPGCPTCVPLPVNPVVLAMNVSAYSSPT